jgi:uncharacterized membrane protein (DUF2068 family)
MDWSLLGCGANGHVTFAPDQPELRERLSVTTREGAAWRCLRCGTFVIGEPDSSGPVSAAPRVRRDKELRSALILRVFAVERGLRAIIFGALAIAIWRFSTSRLSIEAAYDQMLPALRSLLRELGFNVNHSKLLGLIQHTFKLTPHTLTLLALAAGAYAVIEVIEAVGLWLLKRWGEYFAMIATSVGIPYEIYDLTAKVTWLRLLAFIINVALVVYLVVTKRLFGVRGGKKAYEARLRSASILQAEIDAVAAGQATRAGQAAPAKEAARAGEVPQAAEAAEAEGAAQAEKAAQAGEAAQTGEAARAGEAARVGEAAHGVEAAQARGTAQAGGTAQAERGAGAERPARSAPAASPGTPRGQAGQPGPAEAPDQPEQPVTRRRQA